ncbi:hypothetical protein DMX04_25305 [Pseudomonas koreensis]|nr:hypothetical protein DMX04_25305 [Pseudomonas koreensis]
MTHWLRKRRNPFASRLAPTGECIPSVGASLLAKGPSAFHRRPDRSTPQHAILPLFFPERRHVPA